jgi:hypothetical protein
MTEDDKPVTRAELKAELSALSEQMRDIETALLRAFQSYAQGVAAQLQRLTGAEAAAEIRISSLESRVLELETRRRN